MKKLLYTVPLLLAALALLWWLQRPAGDRIAERNPGNEAADARAPSGRTPVPGPGIAFVGRVMPFFDSGRLVPLVHVVMSIEEVAEAHRMMEGSRHFGKIVLKVA